MDSGESAFLRRGGGPPGRQRQQRDEDEELFWQMKRLVESHARTQPHGVPVLRSAVATTADADGQRLLQTDGRWVAPDVLDGAVCQDLQVIDACRSTGVGDLYNRRFGVYEGPCRGNFLSGYPIYRSKSGYVFIFPLDRYPDNWNAPELRGLVRWRLESFHKQNDRTTCRREFQNIYQVDFAADGQPYKFFPTIACFDTTGSDTDGYKSSTINIRCNDAVVGPGVPTDPPLPDPDTSNSDTGGGSGDGGGMSGGAVLAIVIVVLGIVAAVVYYYCKRTKRGSELDDLVSRRLHRRHRKKQQHQNHTPSTTSPLYRDAGGIAHDGQDDYGDEDDDVQKPKAAWMKQQDFKNQLPGGTRSDDEGSSSGGDLGSFPLKFQKTNSGHNDDDTPTSDSPTASDNNLTVTDTDDATSSIASSAGSPKLRQQQQQEGETSLKDSDSNAQSRTTQIGKPDLSSKPPMARTLSQRIQDQRARLRNARPAVQPSEPEPVAPHMNSEKMKLPSADPPAKRAVLAKRSGAPAASDPPPKRPAPPADNENEDDAVPSGIRDMVDHLDGLLASFDADDLSDVKSKNTAAAPITSTSTQRSSYRPSNQSKSPRASGPRDDSSRSPSPDTPVQRRSRSLSKERLRPRTIVSPLPQSLNSPRNIDDPMSHIPPAFRKAFERSPHTTSNRSRSLSPNSDMPYRRKQQQEPRQRPKRGDAKGRKAKSQSVTASALAARSNNGAPANGGESSNSRQRPRNPSVSSKSTTTSRQRPRTASVKSETRQRPRNPSVSSKSTTNSRQRPRSTSVSSKSTTNSQRPRSSSSKKRRNKSLSRQSDHGSMGGSSHHKKKGFVNPLESSTASHRDVKVQPDGSVVVSQKKSRPDGSTVTERITYSDKRMAAKHGIDV